MQEQSNDNLRKYPGSTGEPTDVFATRGNTLTYCPSVWFQRHPWYGTMAGLLLIEMPLPCCCRWGSDAPISHHVDATGSGDMMMRVDNYFQHKGKEHLHCPEGKLLLIRGAG